MFLLLKITSVATGRAGLDRSSKNDWPSIGQTTKQLFIINYDLLRRARILSRSEACNLSRYYSFKQFRFSLSSFTKPMHFFIVFQQNLSSAFKLFFSVIFGVHCNTFSVYRWRFGSKMERLVDTRGLPMWALLEEEEYLVIHMPIDADMDDGYEGFAFFTKRKQILGTWLPDGRIIFSNEEVTPRAISQKFLVHMVCKAWQNYFMFSEIPVTGRVNEVSYRAITSANVCL